MIFTKTLQKSLILGTLLVATTACSSKPTVQEFPITASASEEISNLEQALHTARSQQVNTLSPRNFSGAHEALEDAKKMHSKGKDSKDVLYEVALGNAYLNDANKVAEVARSNIEEVVAARQAAVNAGAPEYFGKEWKKIDEDLKDLTEDIEKNKLSNIPKERAELQKKYMDIELKSIKEKYLKQSKDAFAQAKKEKAEKFAPKTFAIAEKSLADTEAFITGNKYSTYEIETRVADTKRKVDHLTRINNMSRDSKNLSTEEMALAYDQEQTRLKRTQNRLSGIKDELTLTQSALSREQSEREIQEKYDAAKKHFSNKEAEVYRQGNSLLIRLTGMKFPTAKSDLNKGNIELLSKVQTVINDFGSSNVKVEGHTDSTGTKAINEKVSLSRAEAVKAYLEENSKSTGHTASFEAEGLGYQRPISSNKTADGRAKNRRVDIIITPESVSL